MKLQVVRSRVAIGSARGTLIGSLLAVACIAVAAYFMIGGSGDLEAETAAREKLGEWGAVAIRGADRKHVETLTLTLAKAPERVAEAMELIQHLTFLSHLDASKLAVTDEHLRHIAKLRSLHSLTLNETPITDAGLIHLAGLPLESLQLASTKITSKGLREIGKLSSLKVINLSGVELADDDWSGLLGLNNLEWLMVNGVKITPKAIDTWGQLPKLVNLTVEEGQISDELAEKLKSARPGLTIKRTSLGSSSDAPPSTDQPSS